MRLPQSQANFRLVSVFLCLGTAVFLQGCDAGFRGQGCRPDRPKCEVTVPRPGTYAVRYKDSDGLEETALVDSINGMLVVCDCSNFLDDPALSSPATADLSVSISDSPDSARVGDTLTYNIIVHNYGPFDATGGLTLVDTLPPELNFVSASSTRSSCTYSPPSRELTCQSDTLERNRDVEISLITEIAFPPLDAQTKNEATISLNLSDLVADPNPANNTAAATTTVISLDGPEVTVAASPDPVSVGNELTYAITLTNNKPESISVPILVDTLPAGVTFVSGQYGCFFEADKFKCIDIEIAAGASVTYQLVVIPTTPGTITNTLSLPGRFPTITTTTVNPRSGADLVVAITDSPDPVDAENLTYVITVTNHGPEASTGGTLTDVLPAGVDFFSHTGRCTELRHVITCTLGALENGESSTIEIVVSPTVTGSISNMVGISGNEHDPDLSNNEAVATTTVIQPALVADLEVTISDSPDPVVVERTITYQITITNRGLATASGITLTDTLPANVTFVANPNCRLVASNTVTCVPVSLDNGASTTFSIAVIPSSPGTISNTVSVTALQSDPNPANNIATETTTVSEPAPTADLSITISDSPDPVVVNQPLTYNITITNNGLAAATDIFLTDTLPPGVNFSGTPECRLESNNTIACIPFSLSNGASTNLSFVVTPTAVGTITNTVNVTASESDPNTTNNTATETTTVTDPTATADLSITISDSPDPVVVNQPLTYNITVTNNGLATATDILLTDSLPAGVTFIANPDCHLGSNNIVACTPFSLPNGASATAAIVVTPTAAGTISNTVSVTALQSDSDTTNNTATETTTVNEPTSPADLSLTVSDSPDPVRVNNQLSYAVTVTNNGPGLATGITLTDTLPSSVSFIPNADCQLVGSNTVICNSASLPNGASTTFTITVVPTTAGTITNTVAVAAVEPDPILSNNTVTETTTVEPPPAADLSVTISDSPDPGFADEPLTYSIIVTNNGPDSASGVTATDTLPANVSFIASPNCQLVGNTVTCNPVTLASGASTTFTISVTPTIEGTVTNTVSVAGLVNDPDATNNMATATTAVSPSAGLVVTITDSPDPVGFNSALTYTVTVTNTGPSTATNVVLSNLLPPIEVNDSDIVLSQGTFTRTRRPFAITCNFGTLPSGASATLTVTGFTFAHGTITWTASVTATEHDPNPANNSAAENTTVN